MSDVQQAASGRLRTFTWLAWFAFAFVGSLCVALKWELLAQFVLTAALLACLFAGAAAFALRGSARAYCGGLSFVGLCYIVIALHPWFVNVSANLVTTRLLVVIWQLDEDATSQISSFELPRLRDDVQQGLAELGSSYPASILPPQTRSRYTSYDALKIMITAGQATWAMVLALPAGLLCYFLNEWRRRREGTR